MAESVMVYAFGRGTITPYEPSREIIETRIQQRNSLKPGTFKYESLDFIRIGLGLPSLDEII
jgi:hypothetical protein